MRSPVLFLVFNRPDTTRRVFDAIRVARPPKLYVAADGPRPTRSDEAMLCAEVRDIATAVDWPCEVNTSFQDHNIGCKGGVSGGIGWFFGHEEEGIVLEDDVLPVPTFFDFCDEMLERYRNDARVTMVSGCNLIANRYSPRNSYFFSRYNHIWGWASWRRAWQHYDVTMAQWPAWRDGSGFDDIAGGSRQFKAHWRRIFNAVYDGKVDTWDYQWTFAAWHIGSLAILPSVNQTQNLGFGADATHTTAPAPEYVTASRVGTLQWPLVHPDSVERDAQGDRFIESEVFGIRHTWLIKRIFRRICSGANSGFAKRSTGGDDGFR